METIYPRPSRSGPHSTDGFRVPCRGLEFASLIQLCPGMRASPAIPRSVYEMKSLLLPGCVLDNIGRGGLTVTAVTGTAMITNSIFYLYFRTSARFCHALMPPSSVIYHCPARARARSFSIVLATAILSRETMNTTSRKVTEFIILYWLFFYFTFYFSIF